MGRWARCAGRCAAADSDGGGRAYGPRTPVVSLATALLCAGLAAATDTRPELAVWLLLAPVGVLLALVDLRVRRLPDVLTLPLAAAALGLLGAGRAGARARGNWPTALLGALALGAGYSCCGWSTPAAWASAM